ncbi:MAG: aminotransferase class I/II-fold pyridoxal phosphate-dependent enzyme [Armatimonadota bacterium]|nr:aminotransferase class I/II-fold pyridoxal phosphate-dependent enzyme [Armatimonadota bacterium]MDR7533822.1 aminotransferase class I/II-fold pyridoxal phosphate-dependent enzyme [Armatimonadota bacterium]MDR7536649.1 aminotransferase class I/II-fold pyridoxal phosphate-dependent enzyme [Armatimonadota bacterium]
MTPDARGFQTRAIHGGTLRDPLKAVSPPIYQTSTFWYETMAEGAALGADRGAGWYYTRWGNPTTRLFEERMALLEDGEDALATASGMGAITVAVLAAAAPGTHAVVPRAVYQATFELARDVLPRQGVEVTFIDAGDPAAYAAALRPTTRLLYVETPNNPLLEVTDLTAVVALARRAGAVTIADSTFASPYNQTPLALGVDLVVHSATKYLGGHSDVSAGVVVGRADLVARARRLLRVYGAVLDPFAAWLLLRGLKTLGLRMERHNANAQRLAEFLAGHPRVARVNYPGLSTHPQHAVAVRQMRGFGGMLSFEVQGGFDAGVRTCEALRTCLLAVSLGGPETLVTHPASTSSAGIPAEDRRRAGIGDGLIRVSVGLEDVGDLIADFEQALRAAA